MYKIINDTLIERLDDGAAIPRDEANIHYQAFLEWERAGGVVALPQVSDDDLAELIRQERDAKLRDSDWSQLADIADSVRTEWAVYRQALRDITGRPNFPHQVEWPAPPNQKEP